jgi:Kef-type K+ transport system membrane component KefB
MEVGLTLVKISLVLLIGFIGSILARKVKLPNVSGYLVLGLLLGPSLGIFFESYEGIITHTDQSQLKFISEIALAFIAFSIGSEFAIKSIKKMGKNVMLITLFEVIGAVLVVFTAMMLVPKPVEITSTYAIFGNRNVAFSLILASMSVATAPAATLMVIRQYRAYGPVTKTILPVTALDDIYGIVVFGFFMSFAQILNPQGVQMEAWLMFAKPFIEVFGSILLGSLIGFILAKVADKFDKVRDDIQVLALLSVVGTVGIVMVLNHYLEPHGIGFSHLLANIMVGSIVSNLVKSPNRTFSSINDLATPFFIMFFTLAGADLNLGIIGQASSILIIAIVYIFARGFGKMLGVWVGAKLANSPDVVRKYLGFALLPQGGISIGLLVIVGAQMNEFYPVISTIIMLSILVYETLGPIFAKIAIGKAGEIGGMDRLDPGIDLHDFEAEGGH